MYVRRIVEDNWSGVRSRDVEYECKTVQQVAAAIKKLNGRNKTSVHFEGDGEMSLTVSGGNDARYVAFVTIGVDDEFYNLVDLRQPEDQMLDVVAGGQLGTFPARHCVDLEAVLNAARHFAIDGRMTTSLPWERQS